ncbi:hypothetical protein NJ76_31315 [Rhodococcus sp. IITR03]|nr:hypothetical protein NJ76_31315 [Rhodococcus sp. IITR03]
MQPDNDIASLFDPNFDEPEPAVVPPGALPPSWAAAMAASRTAPPSPAPARPPSRNWRGPRSPTAASPPPPR